MRHVEAAMVALVAALFASMLWAGATVTECVSGRDGAWECTRAWTGEPVEEPGLVTNYSYDHGNPLDE